ncbi:hypothetical protein NE237_023553 [Protea cynaroides]|uniref:Uncharacterized protein n=1 Tax=Protea cynaroides TaxID=273540 RepID=A0A9Q0HD40_9MAGN|nr:hypothetical protein NE237_023553 [Protea cynaroides]
MEKLTPDLSGEEGAGDDVVDRSQDRPEKSSAVPESGEAPEPLWISKRAKKKRPAGPQKQFLFPTRPSLSTRLPLPGCDPVSVRQVSPPILVSSSQPAMKKTDQSGPYHLKPKNSNFAPCPSPAICSPNSFGCLDQSTSDPDLLESEALKISAPPPFVSSAGHTPFPLVNRTPLKPPILADVAMTDPPIPPNPSASFSPVPELPTNSKSFSLGTDRVNSHDLFPSPIAAVHMEPLLDEALICSNKSRVNENLLISQEKNAFNLENENRDHENGVGVLGSQGNGCYGGQ